MQSSGEKERTIDQMCAFILQEAREKANEINLKTQEERDKALSLLDVEGRQQINMEHARNVKELNTKKKIMKAQASMKQASRKMEERQRLITEVQKDCLSSLNDLSKGAKYKEVCLQLLVQSLLKMQEKQLKVRCRESDVAVVTSVIAPAIQQYQKVMQEKCNTKPDCAVKVDKKKFLSSKISGGIVLLGGRGKITLDNTLDTRLRIALSDLQPVVRSSLFPSSVKESREWKSTSMNPGYRPYVMACDDVKKLSSKISKEKANEEPDEAKLKKWSAELHEAEEEIEELLTTYPRLKALA